LPLIRADFVLLEQAMSNLLMNAVSHTPPGTPVEVRARVVGKELILEVADRGPGLRAEQIDRVFDLFYRGDGAKPGGTGLGLPIMKGFVEAQGGQVKAVNRAGGGAEFSIHLPVPEPPSIPAERV
jgi:two-component system sensor histidine kinase KdpD